MLELIRSNDLLLIMVVLPLSIIAHNLFGAALAELEQDFKPEILIKGLRKGFLIYSGIIIYAFISYLMSDLTIQLGGELYSLVDAIYIIIFAATLNYSRMGIEKLIQITKYKVNEEEDYNE